MKKGILIHDSERIRDLIQSKQERSASIETIRTALIEGKASGAPSAPDATAFKYRMLAAHG